MSRASRLPLSSVRARICAAAAAASLLLASSAGAQQRPQQAINVVPLTITNVVVSNGQLVANGLLGTTPFQAPLVLTAQPRAAGAACPVLHLQLGPIHLSVLGLNVDTSAICLDVTANHGAVLGDLLCDIGTLLNGGTPLANILAGLTEAQLATLTNGLTQILNQAVFVPLTSSSALAGASCNVLNLSLGPVNLNVLGVNVHLDNCANGPVTIDVTANPSGGLLGQLLCDLAGALSGHLPPATVLGLLAQIAAAIGQLVG